MGLRNSNCAAVRFRHRDYGMIRWTAPSLRGRHFFFAVILAVTLFSCLPLQAGRPVRPPRPGNNNAIHTAQSRPASSSTSTGPTTSTSSFSCSRLQKYGDVTDDGRYDLNDILCALDGFSGVFERCPYAFVDVAPCGGDGIVDINDLNAVVDAYSEIYACADSCPPCLENQLPVARAGDDRAGTTAASFPFDGRQSTDPDGRIVKYEWDFGDGTRSDSPEGAHQYANAGLYLVTLAVLDSCNAVATDSVQVTVTKAECGSDNLIPTANAGQDRSVQANVEVVFSGAGSRDADGSVAEYWWNFGDGFASGWRESSEAAYTYSRGGVFVATLWVKDNCGAVSPPDTVRVLVGGDPCAGNQSPVAAISNVATVLVGQPISFDGSSSSDPDGGIETYSWSFGDGLSGDGDLVEHRYANTGVYSVTLTVTDNCGAADSERVTVAVVVPNCTSGNETPRASGGPDRTVEIDVEVTFDGSASRDNDGSVVQYWWNFGDGYSTGWQSSPVARHAYALPASYMAKLWVKDNCGLSSPPDEILMTVRGGACTTNVPPVANAGPVGSGEEDEPVEFTAAASFDSDGWLQKYVWNFGDGTSGSGITVSHTFTSPGTYAVTMTVTDNCGAARTASTLALITPTSFVPLDPEVIGWVTGSVGTVQGVKVSANGQRLFVASREFGVVEFDASDPAQPVYSRTSSVFQNAQGISANDNFVMVGGPTTSASVARLATLGTAAEDWTPLNFVAQGMDLYGTRAYFAAGTSGFKAVNLTAAGGPQVTASYFQVFGRGVKLSSDGRYAFVAAGGGSNGGLKVFDVSGGGVSLIGSLPPSGSGISGDIVLSASGEFAYMADYGGGVRVVDIRARNQPIHVRSIPTSGPADRITRAGTVLAVAMLGTAPELQLFDLSGSPPNPQPAAMMPGLFVDLDGVSDSRGSFVFAAGNTQGAMAIDVSSPMQPDLVWVESPSLATRTACATNGTVAVVGGSFARTSVVDISQPDSPRLAAEIAVAANDVVMRGTRAYIAAGTGGLQVFDVGQPNAPSLLGTLPTFARGLALTADGGKAYLAGGSAGLHVVNSAAVAGMSITTTVETPGIASDVGINSSGTHLFVADYGAGLHVFDARTAPPRPVTTFETRGPAGGVTLHQSGQNSYAIVVVVGGEPHLAILDVTNPAQPELMSEVAGLAESVTTYQHYILMPAGASGLAIFDIRDPRRPVLAHSLPTPGSVFGASVSNGVAVLADMASVADTVRLRP